MSINSGIAKSPQKTMDLDDRTLKNSHYGSLQNFTILNVYSTIYFVFSHFVLSFPFKPEKNMMEVGDRQ